MNTTNEHQKKIKQLYDRDILSNQSMLVDNLIGNGFAGSEPAIYWEAILNIKLTEKEAIDLGFDSLEDAEEKGESNKEIFEWWLVTDWLAASLKLLGCVIIESDYGTWWGRTETGQSLMMDGDLCSVASYLLR